MAEDQLKNTLLEVIFLTDTEALNSKSDKLEGAEFIKKAVREAHGARHDRPNHLEDVRLRRYGQTARRRWLHCGAEGLQENPSDQRQSQGGRGSRVITVLQFRA